MSAAASSRQRLQWIAFATSLLTLLTFAVAVATPPLSGPLCRADCVAYPYLDVEARFPRDYLWMFLAIPWSCAFVALAAAAYVAGHSRGVTSLLGLIAASTSGTILATDYFLQLAVVQPALLAGEADGIPFVSQYNPHGLFIALEEFGYLLMAVSFLFIAPSFPGGRRIERALRGVLITGSVAAVIAFAVTSLLYGFSREYRAELALISIDWLTVIVAGVLMGLIWRREVNPPARR